MSKEFDYLVFIGRFQPIHIGHQQVIKMALQKSRHLIILVGSSNVARNPRNPFTFAEREQMILGASQEVLRELHSWEEGSLKDRVTVIPLNDYMYRDEQWLANVQKTVNNFILNRENKVPHSTLHGTKDFKTGLIGFSKDNSSYYLKLFPEWESVNVESQHGTFNSTEIRQNYFQNAPIIPKYIVPSDTERFLIDFIIKPEFKTLVQESKYEKDYRDSWKSAPFPVIIACVDAVVIQSGKVLLVERGRLPGKGLLALPGGHVEQKETFKEAVIRELKEETRIADAKGEIPTAMLASFITKEKLFDDPNRSGRSRVITNAYLFDLPDRQKMYKVRGDDDAASAKWYSLGDLRADMFFEDHAAILSVMANVTID